MHSRNDAGKRIRGAPGYSALITSRIGQGPGASLKENIRVADDRTASCAARAANVRTDDTDYSKISDKKQHNKFFDTVIQQL